MVNWGSAGKGAAGGAATGAAIGSVVPGYGTAIGAAAGGIIGGLGGLFSGDDDKPQYQDRDKIMALINRGYGPGGITQNQAPQLQMQDQRFRDAQLQQLNQLQGIASGQQQGAGELAVQRQYANALAAQQAQARMARGANAALAYRNAANQSAALGSSAAGMGQQSAMQDQMNAQGLLSQVGAVGRQGDFNVANANAGYLQGNQQLNAQSYIGLLNQLNSMNGGQMGAQAAASQAAQQRNDALLGAGISSAGTILAAKYANQRSGAPAAGTPDAGNSGYTGDSSTWGA